MPSAPSPTPQWAGWALGTAVVLVVGLLACVGFLALRPTSVTVAAPAAVSTPSTVTSVYPVSPAASTPTARYSSSTDTPAISAELLSEGAERDRAQVESLAGSWVPELSAKRPGTAADGITYDATSILSHYNQLSDSHGPVLLLNSSDWPVFREGGYWVVVAARPFSTAAQANAWCSSQGIGADNCFAKRLAHSGDSAANTAPRS